MAESNSEPSVMAQRIYDAAEKLNYPGGYALYLYLKNNKQYVPYKVIQEVYDKENAVRQLFFIENGTSELASLRVLKCNKSLI